MNLTPKTVRNGRAPPNMIVPTVIKFVPAPEKAVVELLEHVCKICGFDRASLFERGNRNGLRKKCGDIRRRVIVYQEMRRRSKERMGYPFSWSEIGRACGVSHSTILTAVAKEEKRCEGTQTEGSSSASKPS